MPFSVKIHKKTSENQLTNVGLRIKKQVTDILSLANAYEKSSMCE